MKRRVTGPEPDAGSFPDAARLRLEELHPALLRLHKMLLDDERAAYEQVHGRTSPHELLQLVISHAQFAWLHAISEMIVRIDELLETDEPATSDDAGQLIKQVRQLLEPAEAGNEFGRKYHSALQRQPDAVLAHRQVTTLLSRDI
jgi:hypothetical protein